MTEGASGGGVDRDLVGPRQQQAADILEAAHPAADGERHEAALRRAGHHIQHDVAVLRAGADIEEAELIGPGLVIDRRLLHGIAGIAQIDEIDALDDAARRDIEAGDDANLQHQPGLPDCDAGVQRLRASRRSMRPS